MRRIVTRRSSRERQLQMPWSTFLYGWPAVTVALVVFGLAFLTTHACLGFIGASIAAPFCLFVGGYPLFHWAGHVAMCANFLAAYLLHHGRRDVAFTALLPFMMVLTVLFVFALRDITLLRG